MEMIESGVLGPEDRIELIYGVVSEMSPAGAEHNGVVENLRELLLPLYPGYRVHSQSTVNIGEGQILDPDVVVLKKRDKQYMDRLPRPDDILLIVEVANNSIRRDREVKTGIYAAAGIAEYWIADLNTKTMIVQRQPKGEQYEHVTTHGLDAEIDTVNLGDFKLKVGEVFG